MLIYRTTVEMIFRVGNLNFEFLFLLLLDFLRWTKLIERGANASHPLDIFTLVQTTGGWGGGGHLGA